MYWAASVQTDKNGEAAVEFDLSDSVTTFHAFVDGVSTSGLIGQGDGWITSILPAYTEVKVRNFVLMLCTPAVVLPLRCLCRYQNLMTQAEIDML